MDRNQAAAILNKAVRSELRDHAFGDTEISWSDIQTGETVATGYFSGSIAEVHILSDHSSFQGEAARELRTFGKSGNVDRNDTTGPDIYTEGQVMPGLTVDDVFRELTEE